MNVCTYLYMVCVRVHIIENFCRSFSSEIYSLYFTDIYTLIPNDMQFISRKQKLQQFKRKRTKINNKLRT